MERIHIPLPLIRAINKLPVQIDAELGINRYGEEKDLVYVDRDVPWHTDNDGSDKSKNVLLLCLSNKAERSFWHPDLMYGLSPLLPGNVIRFDGSIGHSLLSDREIGGRSSFIIWDVPVERSTNSFVYELQERVYELTKELII